MNSCLECGIDTDNPKFCSRSCSVTYHNRVSPKRKTNTKAINNCVVCGKKLTDKQKWLRQRYCSRVCWNTKRTGDLISDFLEGNYKKQKLSPAIRKFLFAHAKNKCERCGWSGTNKKTGNSVLQVHHKDGNGENHILSNIEIICPNCHAMTKTFGNLNKGNGRKYRRDKYRESYA